MESVLINLDGYDWLKKLFNDKGFVTIDEMIELIDELQYEKDKAIEELEDFKVYVNDNYRPIPYAEQVGISDRDFI